MLEVEVVEERVARSEMVVMEVGPLLHRRQPMEVSELVAEDLVLVPAVQLVAMVL
jgi:hypothetical protein